MFKVNIFNNDLIFFNAIFNFSPLRGKAAQSDPPWPVIFDHPSADLN
jgi:hypothetical protein